MVATPSPTPGPSPTVPPGQFDPNKVPQNRAVTEPGGQATDVFGLNPTEQKWSFFTGTTGGTSVPPIGGVIPAVQIPADIAAPEKPTTATALELMRTFASYASSPDPSQRQDWAATQQQLYQAGAYGSTKPRLGFWGPADAPALMKAFRAYQGVAGPDGAALPVTFSEWLGNAAQTETQNEQAPPATPAVAIPLDDPDTIAQTAQSAAEDALGHGLSTADLQKFVSSFQAKQLAARSTQTGTYADPDVTAQAESFVQSQHPQQYQDQKSQAYMNAFLNLFLPSGSTRANEPVVPTAGGV